MKRFWKDVGVEVSDSGYRIVLDGRPVRTPARAPLDLPAGPLAEAIAAEWLAQGDDIDPRLMPLTGLANAAIDHSASLAATLTPYAETDLLCYRDARDTELAGEQMTAWNPLLAWAEGYFEVEFVLTAGVMHVAQHPATSTRLTDHIEALPPFRLAPLAPLVTISGSLVAALAIETGARDAAELWPILCLDELYQERRWGHDAQAEALRAAREAEWLNAARFLSLL